MLKWRHSIFIIIIFGSFARAETYPVKPVRMLVGFAPGGSTDVTARLLAEMLSADIGQTVIIENKAGAGGNIATAELARSAPDGYTIMLASPGQLVVNPLVHKSPGFDPKTQFSYVGLVSVSPHGLVVPTNSPFKNINDLLTYGRQNKGKLSYASPGIGTTHHIQGEMLNYFSDIQAVHIPYRGGAPAIADVNGGRVNFMFNTLGEVEGLIANRQLRILAVSTAQRQMLFPAVPTLSETFPNFEMSSWLGLVGPPKMASEPTKRLTDALTKVLINPRFIESLEKRASLAGTPGAAVFSEHVKRERERVEKMVVKTGLHID